MKPFFIEIVSCAKDRPLQYAPRVTWIHEWEALCDYKFLLGNGNEDKDIEDEWVLPVNDSWDGKFEKIQAAHRRILQLGYPYVFHISLDCYPIVPRLLTAFHELMHEPLPWQREYVGTKSGGGDYLGEAGFWMSRKAMEVIANAPLVPNSYDDQHIGGLMNAAGIKMVSVPDYRAGDQTSEIFPYEDRSTWQRIPNQRSVHLGRGSGSFQTQWMIDCHRSYLEGGDHHYPRPGL